MRPSTRDEFSEGTKRVIAQRAAYRCSDPSCRVQTVFPHLDSTKSVLTGVAAHICAAAEGGPRYDVRQTAEERRSPGNGIWLCHSHSDRIDKDEQKYSVSILQTWKSDHEEWVSGQNLVPAAPKASLATLAGLVMLEGSGSVDATLTGSLRDHILEVTAGSRHEIQQLVCRLQFPESALGSATLEAPVGVAVKFDSEQHQMMAVVSGSGTVRAHGEAGPSNTLRLDVERLSPGRPVRILIRTAITHVDEGMRSAQERIGGPDSLFTFLEGRFLYPDGGQMYERLFLYPIVAIGERAYALGPSEEPNRRGLFRAFSYGRGATLSTGVDPNSSAVLQGVIDLQKK
jgi:hypothetical protein